MLDSELYNKAAQGLLDARIQNVATSQKLDKGMSLGSQNEKKSSTCVSSDVTVAFTLENISKLVIVSRMSALHVLHPALQMLLQVHRISLFKPSINTTLSGVASFPFVLVLGQHMSVI